MRRLVADGYRVTAGDHLIDELTPTTTEFGDHVLAVELDVTSPEHWRAAVAATLARFGALNALVNNAGVLHSASIAEETPSGFEGLWRVNCLGPFLGLQAALEPLRRADNAAVVNTCSTGAIRPFPHHAAFTSSKWALRGLTQVAAAELGRDGIRVNAIFPGPVETPMLDESTKARLTERATLGRLGKPSEMADAVAFLLSDEAAFITGSELVIDGGQCLKIG